MVEHSLSHMAPGFLMFIVSLLKCNSLASSSCLFLSLSFFSPCSDSEMLAGAALLPATLAAEASQVIFHPQPEELS